MKGTVTFSHVRFEDVYLAFSPMFLMHHTEIIGERHPFDLDVNEYIEHERMGAIKMFAAYRDGIAVGYAVFILRTHLHARESLEATQDAIYILPTHRGFGVSFIKYCDAELKKLGVKRVYHAIRPSFDFTNLLLRIGYDVEEVVFSKDL